MGNTQSNNVGEKIILKILNDYKNKSPDKYNKLNDSDKLAYVKNNLKKYNLYIEKDSSEYKNLSDLITLNNELNNVMAEILKNYSNLHSQNKLFRVAYNLDNIIDNFTKYSQTINTIKDKQANLKVFIHDFLKHQKSYKFDRNKIKSSEKSKSTKKPKKSPREKTRRQKKSIVKTS
jgi:DNA repair ATPase RecN